MPATLYAFLRSELFLLTLTVGVYGFARWLYNRTHKAILNPLIVSMAIIIGFLKLSGIEYATYYEANDIINFLLGLSVVALGYLLFENLEHIRGNILSILLSVFAGSLVSVLSVVGLALLFRIDHTIIASLEPKSVTTPIAVELSRNAGGIPALTSMAVIVVGLLGSLLGPRLLRLIGVDDPIACGLALGAASHAVGTAKAMEMGAVQGAVGGAAIAIAGVMTALVMPIVEKILF